MLAASLPRGLPLGTGLERSIGSWFAAKGIASVDVQTQQERKLSLRWFAVESRCVVVGGVDVSGAWR